MKKLLLLLPLLLLVLVGCSSKETETNKTTKPIEQTKIIGLRVIPELNQQFIDKYKYEDSCNFRIALNIDGVYYNVFRNKNNGVSNDSKLWLDGAVAMCDIGRPSWDWVARRYIMFGDNKVANKSWQYGYHIEKILKKPLDQYKLFVSGVKEWVKVADLHLDYIYE